MLPKINWNKVTMREAIALGGLARARVDELRAEEKGRVVAEAKKLAADAGFDLAEVMGKQNRKKKPRIYHPTDKSLSYGGYGPKPKWLKEIEAV